MRFISLDIETLGLGIDAPVIEVGAVLCDTNTLTISPTVFHTYVTHHEYNNCEPYAMSMHSKILGHIASRTSKIRSMNNFFVYEAFVKWIHNFNILWPSNKYVIAGKNVAGFDLPRLVKQCSFKAKHFHHRVLDPGNMFLHRDDTVPPGLNECLRRVKSDAETPHTALADAILTAEVIFKHFETLQ